MGIAVEAPRLRGDSSAELRPAAPGKVVALERFKRRTSVDDARKRVKVGAHGATCAVVREGGRVRLEEAHGACLELPPSGGGQGAHDVHRVHHALTPGPKEGAALGRSGATALTAQIRRGGRGAWAGGRRQEACRANERRQGHVKHIARWRGSWAWSRRQAVCRVTGQRQGHAQHVPRWRRAWARGRRQVVGRATGRWLGHAQHIPWWRGAWAEGRRLVICRATGQRQGRAFRFSL